MIRLPDQTILDALKSNMLDRLTLIVGLTLVGQSRRYLFKKTNKSRCEIGNFSESV
jgi:hypothetical protein